MASTKSVTDSEEVIRELMARLQDAYEEIDAKDAQLNMQLSKISEVRYDELGRVNRIISRVVPKETE